MPTQDSHWEMNGKTEAQKGEGICHLDLGCTGPRLARESPSDDETSQGKSLVGLSILQTPKVSWGRPASHTRKMLEPGTQPGWLTDPQVLDWLREAPVATGLPRHPAPPPCHCYPSGPCLSARSQTTFIPRETQMKVRCSSNRAPHPVSSLQGWWRPPVPVSPR